MRFFALSVWLLVCLVYYAEACRDLMTACRRARFTCRHPTVGHTVRKNCPKTCHQRCQTPQKLLDHPSCRTWSRRGLCKGRLAAEMSVYCPQACSQNRNQGSKGHTRSPVINNTPTPKPSGPKLSLWSHSLNESSNVCGSFYDFTCGQYQAENKPTSRESFGRLTDHIKLVRSRQYELIFDDSPTQSSAVKKMRQFRDSCMNEAEIERLRTQRLIADIKSMGDLPMLSKQWKIGNFDLTKLLLKINEKSSQQFLFQLGVTEEKKSKQHGKANLLFAGADLLIKNPNDYTDASQKDKIKALKYFLNDLVQILASDTRSQQTYAEIQAAVNELVEFERKIAEIYIDLQLADPQQLENALTQKHKLSDLPQMADSIRWNEYFSKNSVFSSAQLQQELQSDPEIFVLTEELITRLNNLFQTPDKHILANYLIVRFIVSRTPYLDARFGDAARRFAQKLDGDLRPKQREDECVDTILANFPLVIDYLYTKQHLDQKTEQAAKQMWTQIKQGASKIIAQQQWLSTTSRQNTQQKLDAMQSVFGAINSARDQQSLDNEMSKVQFSANAGYLEMSEQIQRMAEQRKFEPLWSTSRDLTALRWKQEKLGSGQVNAFLLKHQNIMFIPTAILHEPLFNPDLPSSVNIGAFGFVVAQVMMRGFDWKGANFDAQGKRQSIWDRKTRKDFKQAKECLYDKYGSHAEPLTGINVDATRTMRNNLADAASIRVIAETYKMLSASDNKVSGYEQYTGEQAMYISYGVTLCASLTKEFQTDLLHKSPYSPNFFRVNIVLANFAEFQRIFNCQSGSRMIANPRCSAWQP